MYNTTVARLVPLGLSSAQPSNTYLGVLLERLVVCAVEERDLGLVFCCQRRSYARGTRAETLLGFGETAQPLALYSPHPTDASVASRSLQIHSSLSRFTMRFIVLCPCATVYFLSVSGVSATVWGGGRATLQRQDVRRGDKITHTTRTSPRHSIWRCASARSTPGRGFGEAPAFESLAGHVVTEQYLRTSTCSPIEFSPPVLFLSLFLSSPSTYHSPSCTWR